MQSDRALRVQSDARPGCNWTFANPVKKIANIAVILILLGNLANAETLTDQLLAQLLEKHLPAPLYQRANNPWPGGNFRLDIFQRGQPIVRSKDASIHVQLPLRIVIAGDASNDFLGFKVNCHASFQTIGTIDLTPANTSDTILLRSAVAVPIPPVTADCDGLQLPIDSYLKAFVAQNERQWELRIDREINTQLAE